MMTAGQEKTVPWFKGPGLGVKAGTELLAFRSSVTGHWALLSIGSGRMGMID